jgi:hypothetical protein
VKTQGERVVKLSDIATVRRTFKDAETFSRINGQQSIALEVVQRGNSNVLQTALTVKDVFEDEGYSFCHDESGGLFPLDHEYCELVEETIDVCPALPKVCKNKLDPSVLKNLPRGRLRFAREGKDYGPKSTQEPKDYADYSQDRGSRSGSNGGDGKSGSGEQ